MNIKIYTIKFLLCISAAGILFTGGACAQTITAATTHSVALCSNGTLRAWGDNHVGALGDGTLVNDSFPGTVNGLTNIIAVTGNTHTLALKSDSTVWAWGSNNHGQCGDSTLTTYKSTPVQVHGLTGVVTIGTGYETSFAVKSDGTVWAWGANVAGDLGIGTLNAVYVPTLITTLTDVISVSGGSMHTIFLKSDSTVWTCGDNGWGQIGDGTSTMRTSPVQVPGIAGAKDVAAGSAFNIVLMGDGKLQAWGNNYSGQLGRGFYTQSGCNCERTADTVNVLSNVVAISAGSSHSTALLPNGTVWAWGTNLEGEIGDSTQGGRPSPVQVHIISDIVALGKGGSGQHSLALKSDGTLWAWGRNAFGQLGNGTVSTVGCFCIKYPMQVGNICALSADVAEHDLNKTIISNYYPNPATNFLTIETGDEIALDKIIISSMLGSIVQEKIIGGKTGKVEINISGLSSGIYFFNCISGKYSQRIKVIIL